MCKKVCLILILALLSSCKGHKSASNNVYAQDDEESSTVTNSNKLLGQWQSINYDLFLKFEKDKQIKSNAIIGFYEVYAKSSFGEFKIRITNFMQTDMFQLGVTECSAKIDQYNMLLICDKEFHLFKSNQ